MINLSNQVKICNQITNTIVNKKNNAKHKMCTTTSVKSPRKTYETAGHLYKCT